MNRILVATDFSAASARARDYAVALAEPGASLTVVHAHPLPLPDRPEAANVPTWMPAEPSVREAMLRRLAAFAGPARAAGLFVDTVLEEGFPADVILAQSARAQPDLIAMGTHGRSGFERWTMGSVAERVARLACSPVLTVSTSSREATPRIREVLCPLGLGARSEALTFASEVARRGGSVLTVMHVVEDMVGPTYADWVGGWVRQRLSEAVDAAGSSVRPQALLRIGRPSREIVRVAQEGPVDLIVMGRHDACRPWREFLGSTAAETVREAPCPVITVPSALEADSSRRAKDEPQQRAGTIGPASRWGPSA